MTRLLFTIGAVLCAFALGTALRAQDASKKAFILVQVEVSNPQQYADYTKVSPGIIEIAIATASGAASGPARA